MCIISRQLNLLYPTRKGLYRRYTISCGKNTLVTYLLNPLIPILAHLVTYLDPPRVWSALIGTRFFFFLVKMGKKSKRSGATSNPPTSLQINNKAVGKVIEDLWTSKFYNSLSINPPLDLYVIVFVNFSIGLLYMYMCIESLSNWGIFSGVLLLR